jgi:hypothetical protein
VSSLSRSVSQSGSHLVGQSASPPLRPSVGQWLGSQSVSELVSRLVSASHRSQSRHAYRSIARRRKLSTATLAAGKIHAVTHAALTTPRPSTPIPIRRHAVLTPSHGIDEITDSPHHIRTLCDTPPGRRVLVSVAVAVRHSGLEVGQVLRDGRPRRHGGWARSSAWSFECVLCCALLYCVLSAV